MKDDGPVWAFCANTLRLFVAGRALKGEDGARIRLHKELGMKGNVKEQHEVAWKQLFLLRSDLMDSI